MITTFLGKIYYFLSLDWALGYDPTQFWVSSNSGLRKWLARQWVLIQPPKRSCKLKLQISSQLSQIQTQVKNLMSSLSLKINSNWDEFRKVLSYICGISLCLKNPVQKNPHVCCIKFISSNECRALTSKKQLCYLLY